MTKRTITGTLFVSISEYNDPQALIDGDDKRVLQNLTFTHCDISKSSSGYSRAGMAAVTIELDDQNTLIENKAESIRAEIKKVRADAENAITQLKDKLNSLLAIAD